MAAKFVSISMENGKFFAKLEIGKELYAGRVATLKAEIGKQATAGIIGKRKYSARQSDFVPA